MGNPGDSTDNYLIELPHGMGKIDLYASLPQAPNFTWWEVTRGGERLPWSLQIYKNCLFAAYQFQKARDVLKEPMRVTSWLRTPAGNAAVGGASNSSHLSGLGIDFYCPGKTDAQVYRELDFWWPGGLAAYASDGHVHLDARPFRARW